MEIESVQLVVTRREAVGLTLGELGVTDSYGCFLISLGASSDALNRPARRYDGSESSRVSSRATRVATKTAM